MHESVMIWAGEKIEQYGLADCDTLEVGSLNVNGSVRGFFRGPYVGIDMQKGPGVDIVALASAIPFEDERFELVISTEMLEHDPAPWLSMPEMGRVLKKGGHLLLSARGNGWPLHGHPDDYWRFMPSAGNVLLELAGCDPVEPTGLDNGGTAFCCMASGGDPRPHRADSQPARTTEAMLASIDHPIDKIVIIDNGGVLEPTHHLTQAATFALIQPGHNLGVSASWNLGLKATPLADWWLIVNHDIEFAPGDLDMIATAIGDGTRAALYARLRCVHDHTFSS